MYDHESFPIFTVAVTDNTHFISVLNSFLNDSYSFSTHHICHRFWSWQEDTSLLLKEKLKEKHIYISDQKTGLILLPLALTEGRDGVKKINDKTINSIKMQFLISIHHIQKCAAFQVFSVFLNSSNYGRK